MLYEIVLYNDVYKHELILLIDEIYHEFGDKIYLEGFDKDLLDIDSNYTQKGGKFWVLLSEKKKLHGSIALKTGIQKSSMEMKRFYLHKTLRGENFADSLYETVLRYCCTKEINLLYLWSDARFERSHNFYLKKGFQKKGHREMLDGAMPYTEYYFEKWI